MNERRLSRQERRARERAEKKGQPRYSLPSLPELSTDDANRLVIHEAKKMGIRPSRSEKALWEPLITPLRDRPLPPNYKEAVLEKITVTFHAMEQSENPYFHEAATFLLNLVHEERLAIDVRAEMSFPENTEIIPGAEPGMATTVDIVIGSLRHFLILPAKTTLYKATPIMTAIGIVHEGVHIRRNQTVFDAASDTSSVESLVEAHRKRAYNLQELLPEEAEAYAEQSHALIYQFGLGQWLMYGDTVRNAAKFIQAGKNSTDPRWLAHVRKNNLSYLSEQV